MTTLTDYCLRMERRRKQFWFHFSIGLILGAVVYFIIN